MSRPLKILSGVLAVGVLGLVGYLLFRFPPDTEPEGAYLRIATSMQRGQEEVVFSYLEDPAQHAAFTIRDYRQKACALIDAHYPEPERTKLLDQYGPWAEAEDGSEVFLRLARERGWLGELRQDLSGVETVDVQGDRATIVTARGTRYPFRRRENGMWGLSQFTAEMVAEAERAARDFDVVQRASDDYAAAARAQQP